MQKLHHYDADREMQETEEAILIITLSLYYTPCPTSTSHLQKVNFKEIELHFLQCLSW